MNLPWTLVRMTCLTEEQIATFHRDGILVIPHFYDLETVSKLRSEIASIISSLDLTESRTVFSTKHNMSGMSRDVYFLNSGDTIKYFWEEKAFDEAGQPTQSLDKCINKIGHALHDLNPVFREVSYERRVAEISRELGVKQPCIPQSMYIFKQPAIGGEVLPHQDGTFLYTTPQSVLGFWWALDDCTLENGCLWAIPGSHTTPIRKRFRRTGATPQDNLPLTEFVPPEPAEWDTSGGVPLECPAGSLVLIHHSVIHWSGPNPSQKSRHAYSIHVIDGSPDVEYPKDNWLQRSDGKPFNEIKLSS